MNIEETIERLKLHKELAQIQNDCCIVNREDLETVLQALDNSIPKEKVIDKIQERKFELQQEYKDFKDDIKLSTLQELLEE